MKTFTVISVIIFVLTLVATLLGVGAIGTPIVEWELGFWALLILEIFVALFVFSFFKRRKWL